MQLFAYSPVLGFGVFTVTVILPPQIKRHFNLPIFKTNSGEEMISAGLVGATGYTGKKLISFCSNHPFISDFSVYAASTAGKMLWDVFPDLEYTIENKPVLPAGELSFEHDVYFLTLPHGGALEYVPKLIAEGKKVIDLGGDYRLDFEELYRQWYHLEHTSPYLLKSKVYGLADFVPEENYGNAGLIANPGCYPTATLLSLLPLVNGYASSVISASTVAYSGTSGAGKTAKPDLMMSEMSGNVRAYNVNTHRHEPEILQMLYRHKFKAPFSFTAHLLPLSTGIYATTVVHLKEEIQPEVIQALYTAVYADKTFVRLRNTPPDLQWVVGTNFCDVNINVSGAKVIITAAIDNLIKGAAGQAMQNLNKMYGWDESYGLKTVKVQYA